MDNGIANFIVSLLFESYIPKHLRIDEQHTIDKISYLTRAGKKNEVKAQRKKLVLIREKIMSYK